MINLLDLASLHSNLSSISGVLSIVPDMLVTVLCRVFAFLVIYFSTKYRNGEQKVFYYVLAVFFPLISLIVFAIKRKEMNGIGMKVCPSCHRKYPQEFVTCYQCNIELPPYNAKKKNNEKVIAIIMSVLFGFTIMYSLVYSVVELVDTAIVVFEGDSDSDNLFGYNERKGFEDENGNICYYDMKGKAYSDPDEIVLYTKDGIKYVFSNATEAYQGSDGNTIDFFSAFIDSDGYLVSMDTENLYFGANGWIDEDGNKYYNAQTASWDKDGKLITE